MKSEHGRGCCTCSEPKLGVVDGDRQVIVCSSCSGVLGGWTDIIVGPAVNSKVHKNERGLTMYDVINYSQRKSRRAVK